MYVIFKQIENKNAAKVPKHFYSLFSIARCKGKQIVSTKYLNHTHEIET